MLQRKFSVLCNMFSFEIESAIWTNRRGLRTSHIHAFKKTTRGSRVI